MLLNCKIKLLALKDNIPIIKKMLRTNKLIKRSITLLFLGLPVNLNSMEDGSL